MAHDGLRAVAVEKYETFSGMRAFGFGDLVLGVLCVSLRSRVFAFFGVFALHAI